MFESDCQPRVRDGLSIQCSSRTVNPGFESDCQSRVRVGLSTRVGTGVVHSRDIHVLFSQSDIRVFLTSGHTRVVAHSRDIRVLLHLRLEALERHTRRANGTLLQENAAQQLLELLKPIIEEFKKGNGEDQVRRGYHSELTETPRSTRGALRLAITNEQLNFLVQVWVYCTTHESAALRLFRTVKRRLR
ncbi:hypothetical protein LSAT2_009761 [Lamellibrachia satsuma]|nr:hypothetical protein LSAT2_009761 [Lamellibrachia satsuma]